MIERLKQTFEYQSVFVNHASHELRTPLAVMLSQTEAALNNQLNEVELRKVLLSLKDDQQGIIELTNSLLLLSQYEKNDDRLGWENIRLDELVYECMAIAKKVFPKIEISFNFIQIPEEMDLVIFANKSLLATALKNLIKNGYQYSYDKQININLLVNKLVAEITVENNGKEVPEEQREQLFQPFFRAKNVDMEMGYGLGLAIVQRIVQAHYGKIIYKVCDTGRNCFTIVLQKQKPVE
jgi:signal transduction histidine kinase